MRLPKRRVLKQCFEFYGKCVERMKPFILLFKWCGIFANKITEGQLKRCSWPFYGICVFWVSIYISYTCYLLYGLMGEKSITTRLTIDFIKHLIGYISLSVNSIVAYSSQNHFSKFFDRLDSYDYEVAQMKNKRKDNLWIPWITTLSMMVVILLLVSVMVNETSVGILFFIILSDIFTMIMHICGTLEKFLMLYLVLERFKHLNKKIAPNVTWDERRLSRKKQCKIKVITIANVKNLHSILYDAQQTFSDIFNNFLVVWFASLMMHILANIHVFREKSTLVSCAFVIPSVMQLLILCAICHYTAEEANKIPRILNESMSALINSGETIAKLDVLTYFLHKRVFFDAAGFFTIDLPLFQSIVASITTYFIILI